MNVEDRLRTRILQAAHHEFVTKGEVHLSAQRFSELASEEGANEQETEHVLGLLIGEGLLETPNWHYFTAGPETALYYETDLDRHAHWRANALRRQLLLAGAEAYRSGEEPMITRDDRGAFAAFDWNELWGAARMLEALGLSNQWRGLGTIRLNATAEGFEVARDERTMLATLPMNAAEDELAHAPIAADALKELIRDTEQMLRERGWDGALRELGRGDDELANHDWVDAVSEYYAATESGLKHRLDELGKEYSEGAALKDLVRSASGAGAIPANYQALFSFIDSIRSPRRHGAGSQPEKVEIGPAEALLMANHVRSLLLYLGHRPK